LDDEQSADRAGQAAKGQGVIQPRTQVIAGDNKPLLLTKFQRSKSTTPIVRVARIIPLSWHTFGKFLRPDWRSTGGVGAKLAFASTTDT
jgi:hypothetical protein